MEGGPSQGNLRERKPPKPEAQEDSLHIDGSQDAVPCSRAPSTANKTFGRTPDGTGKCLLDGLKSSSQLPINIQSAFGFPFLHLFIFLATALTGLSSGRRYTGVQVLTSNICSLCRTTNL